MFLVNSRYPLVCAPYLKLPSNRACLFRSYASNLPNSFNIVLSSALVYSTCPPVSVYGTVLRRCYFPGQRNCKKNPLISYNLRNPSPPNWCRNINLLPISYASQPHLRGRLTLRRLALRRKPWTFSGRVSHSPFRYSCQHSHF